MPLLLASGKATGQHAAGTAHSKRENGMFAFDVNAAGFARATPQEVWRVLTDYDALPRFVPGLTQSTVLSRKDGEILVEQQSTAGFLFITQTTRLVVRIVEHPLSAIDVSLVEGDMQRYDAHWTLAPAVEGRENGTRITYSGTMAPAFFAPPFLVRPIVEANVKKTVDAVIAEIERRAGRR
jgi:ribosome-associated toxin RatA of RatAB toxin-antitoxin module